MDISVPLPADLVPDDLGISLEADALKVDTAVHTAGLELSVSEKLAFFVPFVTVMPYFQRSSFTAAIPDFDAVIGEGDNKISYSDQAGENADPGATVNLYDFALAARGGFDLVLGGFGLFVHAQYNLATGAPAVTTGTRLSF
jgi:hypothetical protein